MTDFQFNLMLIGSSMAVSIAATWFMWKLLDFVCHFKDCEN